MYFKPVNREKVVKKLISKGLKPVEIRYYMNQLEKRHDLSLSHHEVQKLKKIIHSEEVVKETSSLDPTRVIATKRENDGTVGRTIVRKNLVKEKKQKMANEGYIKSLLDAGFNQKEIDHLIANNDEVNENLSTKFFDKFYKRPGEVGRPSRNIKKRLKSANTSFVKKIANQPGKLGGAAELQRRLAKKMVSEQKIDRRKVGKVRLTPGKPMSKKQYAKMKETALSKKKIVKAKPVPKSQKPVEELSGLDLITQHPMNKQIRSVLATIPKTEHKEAAVNWLTKAIKDHKDNHVQSFVGNPFETMKSILNDRPKKTGPSLPKLKFMGEK